MKSSILNNSSS